MHGQWGNKDTLNLYRLRFNLTGPAKAGPKMLVNKKVNKMWINTKNQLPENGKDVLVFDKNYGIIVGCYYENQWFMQSDDFESNFMFKSKSYKPNTDCIETHDCVMLDDSTPEAPCWGQVRPDSDFDDQLTWTCEAHRELFTLCGRIYIPEIN